MDWARVLEAGVVLVLVPAVIWGVRMLLELKNTITEIRVALLGIDGQNGIRGDVRDLKDRVDRLDGRAA